jgi:hypothetical protein
MPVRFPPTGQNPSQTNTYPRTGTPPDVGFPYVGSQRSSNAVGGVIGAKPTPLATGITSNLKRELPKLTPELAAGVRDLVARKRATPEGRDY